MEYVAFDLETSGLEGHISEILQIGAYRVQDGLVTDKFCTFIKPKLPISYTITQVNGITNAMVADSEPEEVVLSEFLEWLGDRPLVGHNSLGFDYKYLKVRGEFAGLDFSNGGKRMGWDTLLIARKCLPDLKHHKLTDVRDYYGIKLAGSSHRADYDALITKLIFDRYLLNNLVQEAFNYEEELSKKK